MKAFAFVSRIALAWAFSFLFVFVLWLIFFQRRVHWAVILAAVILLVGAGVAAFSHVRRVGLIADRVDSNTLASRHRRQIEIPLDATEAFDLVEATFRELPRVERVEAARGGLQVEARVRRATSTNPDFWGATLAGLDSSTAARDRVSAIVTPGEATCSVALICEPCSGAWIDWYLPDQGANLGNMAALTRSITRRLTERMRQQQLSAKQAATEKELAVAKLSLLHAQVEPHFLYNTLASAQYLTRSDPARADQMLGNLIVYLRHSMPQADDAHSTLGAELERARAYLEILKIRMGERLTLQIQVPDALNAVPMPAMMLQTLVENAIKHGLEPVTGGGTIWVLARENDGKVHVTVADDGKGFSEEGGGTGIGLKNVRERLRLAYGDAASFAIVANFPKGVAATITVPVAGPKGGERA